MSTKFQLETIDGVAALTIDGKVRVEHLDDLEDSLEELRTRCHRAAVVDLMGCPFLASRVFPVLLMTSMELEGAGKFLLVACGEGLLEILRVLRLDRKLAIFSSRREALEGAALIEKG